MLNVEEKNLLVLFITGHRESTMMELNLAMEQAVDNELKEIFRRVLNKVSIMTDEEFDALELSMDEEAAYDE